MIVAVANPDSGIPGETSTVTITVKDKNTGLPIDGEVSIDGQTLTLSDGTATYEYTILDTTLRAGTVLTAEFTSPDYESVSADVTIYRLLIPTTTVVEPVTGTVGTPTTVTAIVTSSNGRPVTQGKVTFTYNGQVIGVADVTSGSDESASDVKTASPTDSTATISVVFNNSIKDGLITADYVDDSVGELQIFDSSSSSADIDESGRTNVVPGEAVITAIPDPASGVPGVTSVVDITVTDRNTGLPVEGTVAIDGTSVAVVDGKGTYSYPITVDTSLEGTTLTATFTSPDYREVSDEVVISRQLVPTNTDATVINNTAGNVTVRVNVTDDINGEPVPYGEVDIYVNDTLVGKGEIENGTVEIVINIDEPGDYDITIKYNGNDVYTDSEDVLENVEVVGLEPKIIKIGFWKLVCFNSTPERNNTDNNTNNKVARPSKIIKPTPRYKSSVKGASKYQRAIGNYKHRKASWKKPSVRPVIPPISKVQYRLFIVLYKEYFEGDISFSDFVAILKLNGIEIASLNTWNENGEIIIDYDNLEDVPDSIEIIDNSGHLEDYTQSINKNNAPDSNGVIDSGDVEVKAKASNTQSSNVPSSSGSQASSNAESSGDSGVAAASGE